MVFLNHVQNLYIHAEKTHKDSGAHCMNMLILYMVQKTHTGPYYRVQALFMYGVIYSCIARFNSCPRKWRPCGRQIWGFGEGRPYPCA